MKVKKVFWFASFKFTVCNIFVCEFTGNLAYNSPWPKYLITWHDFCPICRNFSFCYLFFNTIHNAKISKFWKGKEKLKLKIFLVSFCILTIDFTTCHKYRSDMKYGFRLAASYSSFFFLQRLKFKIQIQPPNWASTL